MSYLPTSTELLHEREKKKKKKKIIPERGASMESKLGLSDEVKADRAPSSTADKKMVVKPFKIFSNLAKMTILAYLCTVQKA